MHYRQACVHKEEDCPDNVRKSNKGSYWVGSFASRGQNGRRCSLCKTCGTVTLPNQTARWKSHTKTCSGLKASILVAPLSAEAQRLVVQCTAGGERHLSKLCDGYIVAYWLYKHKLPFAMAPKVHEVMLRFNNLVLGFKLNLSLCFVHP